MSLGTGRIRSSATSPPPPRTTLAPGPFGIKGRSDIGDPQAGMRLVPAVDGYEVGGQRLDLAAVAQAARVDAAYAGDPRGQGLHQVGGLAVVTEHEDVLVQAIYLGVEQQD